MSYIFNVLIGIDQLANALLAGDADETLSSRAWRMKLKGQRFWGWTASAINLLFFDPGHCKGAYESDRAKRLKD